MPSEVVWSGESGCEYLCSVCRCGLATTNLLTSVPVCWVREPPAGDIFTCWPEVAWEESERGSLVGWSAGELSGALVAIVAASGAVFTVFLALREVDVVSLDPLGASSEALASCWSAREFSRAVGDIVISDGLCSFERTCWDAGGASSCKSTLSHCSRSIGEGKVRSGVSVGVS